MNPPVPLLIATGAAAIAVVLLFSRSAKGSVPMNTPLPSPLRPFQGTPTPAMTAWASSLVKDATVPMGATRTRVFDGRVVIARVEKHTWTYRNGVRVTGEFRGVTLYEGT